MSEYTIKNFKEDISDLAAARMPDSGTEARFARDAIESEHLGVSYFSFAAGRRAPFGHSHREQEEVYVVVSGTGRVRLDDEIKDLRQWDVVRVAPRVVRAFEAGPEGLTLIAIGNDRPEGGDGEMVQNFWTD